MEGDKYQASGSQSEFQPGSRGRVLRNREGIQSAREMARRESGALLAVTEQLIDETSIDQRFGAGDLCRMHRLWLGDIYSWAGQYRQVNMSKDGFTFAAANQIHRLMEELERGPLRDFTPCLFQGVNEQAHALGVVHAELVLIHPFREGNGRCSRLLATLMALQAGLPLLDFDGIRGKSRQRYFLAIQAAIARDYEPIGAVFRSVIERTLRKSDR